MKAVSKIKWTTKGESDDFFINLPRMTDTRMLATMKILSTLINAAYIIANDRLLTAIGLNKMCLTVRHGLDGNLAFGFAINLGSCIWVQVRF